MFQISVLGPIIAAEALDIATAGASLRRLIGARQCSVTTDLRVRLALPFRYR
jgi:hypothetical protein